MTYSASYLDEVLFRRITSLITNRKLPRINQTQLIYSHKATQTESTRADSLDSSALVTVPLVWYSSRFGVVRKSL